MKSTSSANSGKQASTNQESFLERIFKMLNNNKSFPYYQAERRVDIFINFFLEDIIQQHTKFKDAIYVAAEFPLKKNSDTDHAAHIDYVMYSESLKCILFVELKTDNKSFDKKQIKFYNHEPNFLYWFNEMKKIKMNRFKDKKDFLLEIIDDKIGVITEDLTVQTVVLIPSFYEKNKESNCHIIQLNDIEIETSFQTEWKLFKEMILSKLDK